MNPGTNPFDKFNEQSRELLTASYQIVMEQHHANLEIEHLLLAMIRNKNGDAYHIFERLGIDLNILRGELQAELGDLPTQQPQANAFKGFSVSMYISFRLQKLFKQADIEREQRHETQINPEHLLLAVIADPDDKAAKVLARFGADREGILKAMTNIIEMPTSIKGRHGKVARETLETNILVEVDLDGDGKGQISTGIGFLDHMLTLFAKHAGLSLIVQAKGDLWIDDHHTVEDVGIALGQSLKQAFGEKVGIQRYGHAYVPMDETLVRTALDVSGRPFLVYEVEGLPEKVGQFDCQLIEEFWRAVTFNAGLTVHVDKLRGKNAHHILEAVFKSYAQALRDAARIVSDTLPSTKGKIE